MKIVLKHLEDRQLPWGIVTNKPARFACRLLNALHLDQRAACIVCGDTLATRKPHPGTILHACDQVKQSPNDCLYVGDAAIDVIASKSAGVRSLVALYGYIHEKEDPFSWKADGYIAKPDDIISWL
jgi:phosphoglycolate phosphatase